MVDGGQTLNITDNTVSLIGKIKARVFFVIKKILQDLSLLLSHLNIKLKCKDTESKRVSKS